MKHKKLGTLILSFALTFAIAVPVTAGAVYAAGSAEGTTAPDNFNIEVMEKYYEDILASNAVRYGTVAGKNTGGGACLWSTSDINPDYDNVTVSYTYTTNKPKTECYGFGFRFTIGGNRHVAMTRMKNRMPIVQYDTDASVGSVRAKFYADEWYDSATTVGGENASSKLGTGVNTGDYVKILTTEEKDADYHGSNANDMNGFNIFKGGMPSAYLSDTGRSSVSIRVTLRKITEDGVVSWRYYENGEYFFTIQFEDEVTAFAPNLVNPTASHLATSDYEVTLNDIYTDYDKYMDANAYQKKVDGLEVGESVRYRFSRQIDSTVHPVITFWNSETETGVAAIRYAKRIHLNPMTGIRTKGGTQSIYVKSLHTWGDNNAVDLCRADGVYDITNVDASWDIAQNYGVGDQWSYATLTYKIERLANKTINDVEYSVYKFYEGYCKSGYDSDPDNISEYAYAEIGLPVESGVSLYGWQQMTAYPDRIITIESDKLDAMKADTEKNPAKTTTEAFTDKYAGMKDSSVRFTADTQGLRFKASATKATIKAFQGFYGKENVEFGVKLVRADGAYAFIKANNYTETADSFTFNGVVTNIAEANYGVKYTPYVYIRYVDSESVEHYVLTGAGEAKSISEVCAAALADVSAVKTDEYIYQVTVDNNTVYSRYAQSSIAIMQKYIVE